MIALAASLRAYTAAFRLTTFCDSCCPWAAAAVAGAAADCFKLSQYHLCHVAMHGLSTHHSSFCSHSDMAVHGLATHLSSFCGQSSSEECISYALLSLAALSLESSCVCLSTINTPPQSHARPDHTNDPDSSSVSHQSFSSQGLFQM